MTATGSAAAGNRELLQTADTARAAGDTAAARAAYVQAYDAARSQGDVEVMTDAAVGLAACQTFGTFPGRVPAFLHEAYAVSAGTQRARVAVALTRCWVYGGDPGRAVEFATEAVAIADTSGDPALLADALDAQLLVHWGPDDLAERLRITTRLENTVAHLTDVEARLSGHLWRLTTALECLDLPAVRRQLRALEALAADSGSARVAFFAASRRGMYALLSGDLAAARVALRTAMDAGHSAGEADTRAIEHVLTTGIARAGGDTETLQREAAEYEDFGISEGVPSVLAEAAMLWLEAGLPERAAPLLHQLAGADFALIARDVDWLLTVATLTEVAAATGADLLTSHAARLLEPYAGRAVVNAGAVGFVGVVDDYLYQACAALGQAGAARDWRERAAAAYERMGATWWLDRLAGTKRTVAPAAVVHLRPDTDGIWSVGYDGREAPVRDMKGLRYLRLLLEHPGADLPALGMSDAVAGHPGTSVPGGDAGELLDRQALLAYQRRLTELDQELAEAEDWSDLERAAALAREKDALLEQLGATGLFGRPRRTTGANEKARIAVRKAIAAAIARIDQLDPALGRLLRDTVTTGSVCRYEPDPARPMRWVLRSDVNVS